MDTRADSCTTIDGHQIEGHFTDGWSCTWETGPDAGATRRLEVGRHLVGRAHTASVRCDDPALQPHHALLDVQPGGTLTLTQLTGKVPVIVGDAAAEGTVAIAGHTRVRVGTSTLVLRPGTHHPAPAHVVDGALVRSPRALPQWTATTPEAPAAPATEHTPAGGLVPALLGLAGAGLVAALLRQPMFLVFGTLGALVALGSWAAQVVAGRRRRRREQVAYQRAQHAHLREMLAHRARFRDHHLATVPTVATAHGTITERTCELWSRRATHPDAFTAAVGLGELPWPSTDGNPAGGPAIHPAITDELHAHDLPLPVDLGPGSRVALCGTGATSVARALVVQLAASCGPADLRLVVVTDRPARWDCIRALPHLTQPDGSAAIVAETGLTALLADLGEQAAHLLFVTDQPSTLATRTGPLRRVLADPRAHALVVVVPDDAGVPHLCKSVLTVAGGPVGRWVADAGATMLPVPVRVAGLGERNTFACAAALRTLVDPEDPLSVATGMPRDVSLGALLGTDGGTSLTPAGIVATWVAAGADPSPRTLIGMAADGVVDIDLVRDGPHGLIAGTTGAGKSELLRSLVAGMAAGASPAHLSFVLVDYKGGATFDACAALPHVVGVITDLDDRLADRALRSLHAELRRREGVLRAHGAADLTMLRAAAPQVMLPRLVVVIDEFAALVADQPGFLHALVGVAQRGRSLGVHLLLATQRPSGVISDDIRANTNLRLALRLQDTADAIDVVGIAAPALLPRGVPGRAVLRLGADDHLTFQTARCTGRAPGGAGTELEVLVRAIGEAARLAGSPSPPAPWQPPLSGVLSRDEVPVGAVGMVDDPDRQQVHPLHWSPGDGHLLVAGSPGAGVTSALRTVAAHALVHCGDTQVYVLDGRGDESLNALAAHPRCIAVVRLHERERLMRLVHRLRAFTRGQAGGGSAHDGGRVVLFVDGLDAVRRALDVLESVAELDALDEVLADGEAAGLTIVAGVEHVAAVPSALLARCAHRWVMHLHDPHDATLLGVQAAQVPSAGTPGRLVIAATGLAAQLLHADVDHTSAVGVGPHGEAVASAGIGVVPSVVHAAHLGGGCAGDGCTILPMGIDFASGDAQRLQLPDGEHVLVLGGARSGRSNTLMLLAAAWRAAHPTGWVGAIVPRRSSTVDGPIIAADVSLLDQLPAAGPALLLVDDAEAVDDPCGRLAALAAGKRAETWVMADGRPDALRQLYGHWTSVVRRSRTGIVFAGGSDLDGDLLGVSLPRRTPVPARPGLAWLVDSGAVRLTQVALQPRFDAPAAATAGAER